MDKRIDNTNLPFINDKNIFGVWECVDYIKDINDFDVLNTYTLPPEPYLTALKFLSHGEVQISIKGRKLDITSFTWTKDYIINKSDETCVSYVIKNINGEDYLFFEWKDGSYSYKYEQPNFYVLRRVTA